MIGEVQDGLVGKNNGSTSTSTTVGSDRPISSEDIIIIDDDDEDAPNGVTGIFVCLVFFRV